MGIIYYYYNKNTRQYFNMGKGFYWDEKEAIKKLFLPVKELAAEIFVQIKGFSDDFNHEEYANWLAEKLSGFKDSYGPIALGEPEYFEWFDDASNRSDILYFCTKCNENYCECKNPDLPECIGSRYTTDWNGDKFQREVDET